MAVFVFFFFFQAEDGIRDHCVTGVQTCALPIFRSSNTISTCLPSYIQCWPIAEPVYGARYLKPALSEAGDATIVVYSRAPASSSALRAAAMVEPFWPMAT